MQGLFINSFWDLKMDPKKRVSLPAQYRESLSSCFDSDSVVLTISPDRCLVGYPASQWPHIVQMSKELLAQGTNGTNFRRFFLAMGRIVTPDKHGRMPVPPRLAEFAKLDKMIHFIGIVNRFELWDKHHFQAFEQQIDMEALKGPFNELASRFPSGEEGFRKLPAGQRPEGLVS